MKLNLKTITTALCLFAGLQLAYAEQLVDATTLRIINRGWDTGRTTFGRVPADKFAMFNSTAQGNADCTAGVAIRFSTNSRTIGVKYTLYQNTHMNHQAATGTKGMCLYILDGNKWRYVNTIRPADQRAQEGKFVENMDGQYHECMIYLPTYDGVTEMFVKIDDNATITSGNHDAIDAQKRVVMYGTSILQGGCACRPGMCPTAIISRNLNCEVINLAFSGGGKMEQTAAQAIASIENVCAFVVDPVANCDDAMCRDLTYDFVKTLRDAHPGVPVIMVEGQIYPYARYNSYYANYLPKKNEEFRKNFDRLYAENPNNLFLVTADQLDAAMEEGTVEGVHMTDVGFAEYAKILTPLLQPFAQGTSLMTITSPAENAQDVTLTPEITWSVPSRKGTVQIATSATFQASTMVYEAEGTGSVEVAKYVLAAGTQYYARVAYDNGGGICYTPAVCFKTLEMTPEVPAFAHPSDGGTLHANQSFSFIPVEGLASLRLEVSASQSFPSRSSYITGTITPATWADSKTGAEIKLGTSTLVDGNKYYARVRGVYNSNGNTANTEFSPVITFTYSATNGVTDITVDRQALSTEYFDTTGKRVHKHEGQSGLLQRTTYSDGTVTVTKL